eukprot:1762477-Pleurochrysis_carterae.AAC.1
MGLQEKWRKYAEDLVKHAREGHQSRAVAVREIRETAGPSSWRTSGDSRRTDFPNPWVAQSRRIVVVAADVEVDSVVDLPLRKSLDAANIVLERHQVETLRNKYLAKGAGHVVGDTSTVHRYGRGATSVLR